MLKKIESLRTKPKEVRNRYAFWGAFGFTAVVGVFWLVSVPSRLGVFTSVDVVPEVEIEGGVSRSFSDLRASISDSINLFKDLTEDSEIVEEELPEAKKDEEIDFSTFFSSTSPATEVVQRQGKPVLIGTSSQAQSTSTDN